MTWIGPDAPIITQNASALATERIREAIIDGRLVPGWRLKEEELARQFGLSRTPVREALLILQTEGLLEATRNRGATVRSYTEDDLAEMYDLRAVLEGHAAHRAAERITEEQIEELEKSCARFVKLSVKRDVMEVIEENQRFHGTILAAASSARLDALVHSVVQMPLVYKSFVWYSDQNKRVSEHYHDRLVTALRSRDGERAELIMKEHVYEARDFLIARVREHAGEIGAELGDHIRGTVPTGT